LKTFSEITCTFYRKSLGGDPSGSVRLRTRPRGSDIVRGRVSGTPDLLSDSNPYFQINPDSYSDVCQIDPYMYWIHYVVVVSHFAECRDNRPMTM